MREVGRPKGTYVPFRLIREADDCRNETQRAIYQLLEREKVVWFRIDAFNWIKKNLHKLPEPIKDSTIWWHIWRMKRDRMIEDTDGRQKD